MTDTDEKLEQYEKRAPGWICQCKTCGLSEPYGKYGDRIGAASVKKCQIMYCSRCKRLRCHAIKKRK